MSRKLWDFWVIPAGSSYRMPVSRSPGHRWSRVFPWWLLPFSCKSSPPPYPAFRRSARLRGRRGGVRLPCVEGPCVVPRGSHTVISSGCRVLFRGLSRENYRRENTLRPQRRRPSPAAPAHWRGHVPASKPLEAAAARCRFCPSARNRSFVRATWTNWEDRRWEKERKCQSIRH